MKIYKNFRLLKNRRDDDEERCRVVGRGPLESACAHGGRDDDVEAAYVVGPRDGGGYCLVVARDGGDQRAVRAVKG